MVLNTFALISLFVGTVSIVLMTAAIVSTLRFYRQMRACEGTDEVFRAKDRFHLSFLLLGTALLIRLATWPLFYFLMHSFIPLVPGAMCIYGVTRVLPKFVAFLLILKPIAFFLVGGWLLHFRFGLSLKTSPLVSECIRFLAIVSAIAMVDSLAEILFILTFSPPGVAVSCCTAITDLVFPTSVLRPDVLFGEQYHRLLMVCYHGFNMMLIGCIGLLLVGKSSLSFRRWRLKGLAAIALLNAWIAYGAFRECIGPRLLRLPDHHCLYCMLQYRPISIFILGLFTLGSFCTVWPLLMRYLIKSEEAVERLPELTKNLLKCAFIFLLASWIMATTLS